MVAPELLVVQVHQHILRVHVWKVQPKSKYKKYGTTLWKPSGYFINNNVLASWTYDEGQVVQLSLLINYPLGLQRV